MNSIERKLREELDSINESITLKKKEIQTLKRKKEELRTNLYNHINSNIRIIPYSSLKEEDPAIELLNMLNDKDEIELEYVAYLLGISLSALKIRIDHAKIKKYNRYDSRGTIMCRLEVGYIKSILDMEKSDPKMRECLKYILEFHNKAGIPLSLSVPLKDTASPIKGYRKYKDMNICDLIAQGFGRGFIKYPQFNTVVRMLDSYNIGYTLMWTRTNIRDHVMYNVNKTENLMSIKIHISNDK